MENPFAMREAYFHVPMRLPTLNVEINEAKKHWSRWAGTKAQLTDTVALLMKAKWRGMEPIDGRIEVWFDWSVKVARNGQAPDPDNVAFAKKYLLDALQVAGVIQNDGWRNVVALSDTFNYSSDAVDGVDIKIKEV